MNTFENYRGRFSLSDRAVLVAGGSGGIGECVCWAAAASGARLFIGGRSESKLSSLARQIAACGGQALYAAVEVTEPGAAEGLVEMAAQAYGRVDVLINCIGTHIEAPAVELGEEDWQRVLDVNLKSAFLLSQAVARRQIGNHTGKHIHISSVRSFLGIRRGYAAYCASKGGLNMLIRQLASEWGQHGITVNGIAPTFARTELVKAYLEDEIFYNSLVSRIPLGRICEPEDVASLAVFLASPAADFINGQIIALDGGLTACQ